MTRIWKKIKILRDYVAYLMQNARRINTLNPTQRISVNGKPLPAEDIYVGIYLFNLVEQSHLVLWDVKCYHYVIVCNKSISQVL